MKTYKDFSLLMRMGVVAILGIVFIVGCTLIPNQNGQLEIKQVQPPKSCHIETPNNNFYQIEESKLTFKEGVLSFDFEGKNYYFSNFDVVCTPLETENENSI